MAELPLFVLGVFHHFAELLAGAEEAVGEALAFEVGHEAGEDGVERTKDSEEGAVGVLVGGEAGDCGGCEDLNEVDEVDEDAADGEPVAGGLLLVDRTSVVASYTGAWVVEEFPDGLAFGAAEEFIVEFGTGWAAFGFERVGAEGI